MSDTMVRARVDPELKDETDRFWDALEKANEERKVLRDCLDHLGRSQMEMKMAQMVRAGMLQKADLRDFSDELRSRMLAIEAL